MALGKGIQPQLEQAIKDARDPEVRFRLTWIANRLDPSPCLALLGTAEIRTAQSLLQDGKGGIYVFAKQMKHDGAERSAGLAVLHPNGQTQRLPSGTWPEQSEDNASWRLIAARRSRTGSG